MNRLDRRVHFFGTVLALLLAFLARTTLAVTLYWDVNGTTAGAGLSGAPNGTWDTSGGKNNWNTNSAGTGPQAAWSAGDDAVFAAGTDATGSYNVTLIGNPALSSLTIEEGSVTVPGSPTSGNTLNFGAVQGAPINIASGARFTQGTGNIFGGTGGLTKSGDGTLYLRGNNTFTKSGTGTQAYLTTSGGTVDFLTDLNLGALPASNNAAAVTIDGGTLRYGGTAPYSWSNTRGITIGASGGTIEVPAVVELALPSTSVGIAGSGILTKTGAGRLQLNTSQINGFAGKYVITAGSLGFNSHFALGSSTTSTQPDYITLNGGTLRYNGPLNFIFDSHRGITLGPNGGALEAASSTMEYGGVISGTQGGKLSIVQNDGAASESNTSTTINLTGVNTYDGVTQIEAHTTLDISRLANGGTSSGIGQSSRAASNLILDGGTLSYSGVTADASTDRNFSLTELGGNVSTVSYTTGFKFTSTDAITMTGTGSRTLGFNSCFSSGSPCKGEMSLAIRDPASGNTSVSVFGGGYWTLSNPNNSYTGSTTIGSTAQLKLGASGVIPDGSAITFVGAAAATFDLNGFDETVKTISGGSGTIDLGAETLRLSAPGGESFSGIITGTGGRLIKMGTGALSLGGMNTYTGDTEIQAGTLQVTKPYLADGADVRIMSGSLFNLNFTGTDVVDSLFIDGLSQATGTWGGLTSTAIHKSSLFTGSGLLQVSTLETGIAGDFDNDGNVDASDYVAWRKRNGTNSALPNDSGLGVPIRTAHYDLWRSNFGTHLGAGNNVATTSAVPEPNSRSMIFFGMLALYCLRPSLGR